ncbi:MAG: methyltransferase domain-containing protein, partial [Myxococcaceae bacterium]|nr:methyltransferase domain-containing protein [Myxococcaceae bacterium]
VAHHDGRAVFVRGALPGEVVRAVVTEEGRVLRGEVEAIHSPSPARRPSPCHEKPCCGGYEWLTLEESAQRDAKQEIVLSTLEHLGRIARDTVDVRPVLASPRALGYRRRAVLHFTRTGLGFFERGSHARVTVHACPLLAEPLFDLPGRLAPLLKPLSKDGEEVHLLAEGDQVAFSVHLKGPVTARHVEAVEAAVRTLNLRGAVLVPAEGSPRFVGKPVLKAVSPLRPEVPLFLRPDAFSQANAELNAGLVAAAVTQLAPRGEDRVLELFSGNGNFTFPVAAVAHDVVAVESGAVSVELAQRSIREGGVRNVRLVQGDARKACEALLRNGQRFDLLLVDPPRTGAPEVARWARDFGVRTVVYVACDPASLARDAGTLVTAGFRPGMLQVVDMFPQTRHVEAVMSFHRSQE